jgi:site-specific DNA-methyltransferase (adenine-specific)
MTDQPEWRIIEGDCLAVLPTLAGVDAVITDPPYGVNLGANGRNGKHGLKKDAYGSYDDTYENFLAVVPKAMAIALAMAKRGASFIGPHIQEMPKASAIGGVYCPAGSGRHVWGFKAFLPVLFYGTDPLLHHGARPNVIRSTATAEKNGHPCPKPLQWMRWLVELVSLPGETVLDPFMGSGTTGVACLQTGRRFIGIERDHAYCQIARARLEKSFTGGPLFAAVQPTLFGDCP